MLRYARHLTGRPRVAVIDYCYHGSVDEAFATLDGGRVVARRGNLGPPVPPAETTVVVPFNDAGRSSGRWPAATWPACWPSRR